MKGDVAAKLLTLVGKTNLPVAQRLGSAIGAMAWHSHSRARKIAERNLALCFGGESIDWREQIARQSIQAMSMSMLEASVIWTSDQDQLRSWLINPEAMSELAAIQSQGDGLIVAAPHLGSWEYLGMMLGLHFPTTSLFKPPRLEAVADLVRTGRQGTGAALVPTDSGGVKALAKALRQGHATGILPDQEPPEGGGVFADFFGQPAYTMQLLTKLAQRKRIPVVFAFMERLPCGQGFRLHWLPAEEGIYSERVEEACGCMNRKVEALIRTRPDQYNWSYKRFRKHPEALRRYHPDFLVEI